MSRFQISGKAGAIKDQIGGRVAGDDATERSRKLGPALQEFVNKFVEEIGSDAHLSVAASINDSGPTITANIQISANGAGAGVATYKEPTSVAFETEEQKRQKEEAEAARKENNEAGVFLPADEGGDRAAEGGVTGDFAQPVMSRTPGERGVME